MNKYHLSFLVNNIFNRPKEFKYKKAFLELLSIAQISKQKPFIDIVDKTIKLKKQNKNTSKLENKIDEIFYKIYDLGDDEVKIIETI